jgi:hypothetical protein
LYDKRGRILLAFFKEGFLPLMAPSMTTAQGLESRRHARVRLPIAAEVSCVSLLHFEQPAHLRDVSAGGVFFYAEVHPSLGAVMRINFTVPVVGSEVQISCEGRVVRLEGQALGTQSGIAVEFSRLNLGSW